MRSANAHIEEIDLIDRDWLNRWRGRMSRSEKLFRVNAKLETWHRRNEDMDANQRLIAKARRLAAVAGRARPAPTVRLVAVFRPVPMLEVKEGACK